MKRLAVFLLAGLLAPWPAAGADDATAERDLVEDISSALMLATCGRAPNAICHASDGIPESELRARWGRVSQLCTRYKERYKAWPENGVCDSYVRNFDPEEQKARAARWREDWQAKLCEMADHKPPNRAAMYEQCNDFEGQFGSWPSCCSSANITRRAGTAPN